ncbi:MAG: nodulation protein NfeD, partial [Campylobacterales bacterium]|nr:nodulation protein NfeD [Campylobacterales bacterium]
MKRFLFFSLLFLTALVAEASVVVKVEIKGAIGPAHPVVLSEALRAAQEQEAKVLLIELDTPGGLSSSMRQMIQSITNSPLPVISYVSPRGAHAASAGTYLLYASHVAAMSPGTNLGAATPISLAQPSTFRESNTTSTAEKKAINDAIAYITSLAQMNERNVTWAINAVESAQSLSAQDALRLGVIDIIADDAASLLEKVEGRTVNLLGVPATLHTAGSTIVVYEADWKSRFLATVTDPNIAYILLLVAIYGIFFEMMNPGSIFPGVVGVICGVIALFALNMLPFSYAGLLLIVLGIAFMVAEVFVAGFGILGIGGVVAFVFGSLLLFDADTLGSTISLSLVIALSLISLAFFMLVANLFLRSRSANVVTGAEEMVGAEAEIVKSDEEGYHVLCHGEIWRAKSD